MNWIKENKSLAAVFGVMIVGALALGAWVFMSYSTYTGKREEWNQLSGEIKRLEGEKLYPNKENSDEKERLVTEYSDQVDLLRTALLQPKVQREIKPLSETEFQARLKERVNAVRGAAKDKMTLPAEFALGFSEYTASLPRSADVAAELGVQLDVIENIINTFIESGVTSLDSFERTQLPSERGETQQAQPANAANNKAGNRNAGRNNAPNNQKKLITEEQAAEPVLDRYTMKAFLTTDQAPFQAVINALSDPAKTSDFVVVRLLRIENEQAEGKLKEEVRSATRNLTSENQPGEESETPAPEGAAAGARTINAPAPLPKDAVPIMGEEKLKVYLEIDYIRFRPAAQDVSGDKAAATASAN